MNWKTGFVLSLLLLLVVFVVQNYEVVELRFLIWSVQVSRAIVLFLSVLIGIVIGWLLTHMSKKS
ncbi:MAG: hypothetical protein A3J52_02275 [Omnitrophica bacterium RIFCSPHIGHO2_02_FULL_49_9]|nr:MAG: hypothetical protein A3J52_02275 [Omnitrophica bacterium RIFCSPHIGHO2_02_FULL_49_9]OGW89524.1 MAG: hypothetical protein A3A73_02525 [Omnitrophica bacterium RIFCSPLOWO2_01_FULL_50_24]